MEGLYYPCALIINESILEEEKVDFSSLLLSEENERDIIRMNCFFEFVQDDISHFQKTKTLQYSQLFEERERKREEIKMKEGEEMNEGDEMKEEREESKTYYNINDIDME